MPNKLDTVFQQRDVSNTRFVERVISGSGLIIQTNAGGVLVGSSTLQVGTISGSAISASDIFIASNGVLTATTASIGLMIGTASYALNATSGGTTLITGSLYPITSSWSKYAITSSNLNPPGSLLVLSSASFQRLVVDTPNAPATPNDPGVEGEMKFDNNFAYFYANGKWRRVAFNLW